MLDLAAENAHRHQWMDSERDVDWHHKRTSTYVHMCIQAMADPCLRNDDNHSDQLVHREEEMRRLRNEESYRLQVSLTHKPRIYLHE